MRRGIFISIEGPDGSGKSTQIKNIKDYFEGKQFEVVLYQRTGRHCDRRTDSRYYP